MSQAETLENLNYGNHCVMLMLVHSVHSRTPRKAIPEPSLEVVCLHASFLRHCPVRIQRPVIHVKNSSCNGNDIERLPPGSCRCIHVLDKNRQAGGLIGRNAVQPLYCPIPFWTCFARKTARAIPSPTLPESTTLNHWNCSGSFLCIILLTSLLFTSYRFLPAGELQYWMFSRHGNGSCIKPPLFPTVFVA